MNHIKLLQRTNNMRILKNTLFSIMTAAFVLPSLAQAEGDNQRKRGNKGAEYQHKSEKYQEMKAQRAIVVAQLQELLKSGSLSEQERRAIKAHLMRLTNKGEKGKEHWKNKKDRAVNKRTKGVEPSTN